jgi:hypothetical protein
MENLNLDIDEYELNDILNLFHLDKDFDENGLKNAKQIVLKTHPDKSRLDPKYFIFFSKAYKILFNIYTFKNKKEKKFEDVQYEIQNTKNKTLDNFFENNEHLKKEKNFNKWFNEQFDKYKMTTEEETSGYGDWLKSNEDCDEEKNISFSQMTEELEKKKRQVRDLTIYRDISELNASSFGGSLLTGEAPSEYSSDVFSGNLCYQDLRQAHRESVIPITEEDFNGVRKFKSVDDYSLYRDQEMKKHHVLTPEEVTEYMKNKNRLMETESTQRAYMLAKQLEETKKRTDEFLGSLKFLKDK